MTFGTLTLLVLAGLIGPVVASTHRGAPPAVVGEIAAGLVIGSGGLAWVDPNEPVFQTLAQIGFVLLMFIVGTHLPLRHPQLRPALGRGAAVAATVGVLAGGAAWLLAPVVDFASPSVLAVLIATSSAAVALPVLQSIGDPGASAMVTTAWIAIADVATVLALPLVLATGGLSRVLLGGVIVLASAAMVFVLVRLVAPRAVVQALRRQSKTQGWALDLRLSLVVVFALSWTATRFGTSTLLAGFAAGAMVSMLGEPRRVTQQLLGLGEGFLVPIFFVHLGARLDLGVVIREPRSLLLGAVILGASVVSHLIAARLWGLPVASGMVATAQLGVPSAVVAIGLAAGTVSTAQAGAIMAAVLGSMAVCAIGAARLGHRRPITDHAAPLGDAA